MRPARFATRGLAWLAAFVLAAFGGLGFAAEPLGGPAVAAHSVDEVRAAYVVNCIRFSQWPQGAASPADTPFVIGVVDNPELEDALIRLTEGRLLHGRKASIRRMVSPRDVSGCQLLYIEAAPRTGGGVFSPVDWLRAARRAPVLTVSQDKDFLSRGGIINLYAEGKTLRVEIAPANAAAARIKIDSRLLAIARLVAVDPLAEP